VMDIVSYFKASPTEAAKQRGLARGVVCLLLGFVCSFMTSWLLAVFPFMGMVYGIMLVLLGMERLVPKTICPTALDSLHPFPLCLLFFSLPFLFNLTGTWTAGDKVSGMTESLDHRLSSFMAYAAVNQSISWINVFASLKVVLIRYLINIAANFIRHFDHIVSPAFTL